MKSILRNFLCVIRRFSVVFVLNLLGLSVAFAAFMIIMIHLNYELGFDQFHKEHDRILRVERVSNNEASTLFSRPLAEAFFESSPQIIAGTIVEGGVERTDPFYVEKDDTRFFYEEKSMIANDNPVNSIKNG